MRSALVLALLAVPSVAAARPITAGVTLGVDQSKDAGLAGQDPDSQVGLFARLGLTPRLSAQLELSQIRNEDEAREVRSATALLVVDLSSHPTWVPVLLVGIGADEATATYYGEESATHIEGGFGLEYRAPGGLTLGADVRMGGRSIDQSKEPLPLAGEGRIALYYGGGLDEGEYRSARLTLGIRF